VEVCAAAVQLKQDASCSADEIIEFCKGKMASFKISKKVVIVEEFPMTESSKVQKHKLQELFKK
jgi:acyl-CoA synthetase (AMP-forming)/AMP-acid ligase II